MSHTIEASFISYLTDDGQSISVLRSFLSNALFSQEFWCVQFRLLSSEWKIQCCFHVGENEEQHSLADNMQYRNVCPNIDTHLLAILYPFIRWLSESGQTFGFIQPHLQTDWFFLFSC